MLLETLLPKAVLKDLRGEDASVLGAAQMRPTGVYVCMSVCVSVCVCVV